MSDPRDELRELQDAFREELEDWDDDFPMRLEYETPGNAGDYHVEEDAQWDDQ